MTTTDHLADRQDEAATLARLPQVIAGARVMRVGQFIPGGDGVYACVRVLLRWSRVGAFEYSTHLAVHRDDAQWIVTNGHYYPRDGYPAAAADLLIEDVEQFTKWLRSRGYAIIDAEGSTAGETPRVVPFPDVVAVYESHLREE